MKRMFLSIVLPLLLLFTWQMAVMRGWWPRTLIAAPSDVAGDFFELARSGELIAHARVSLIRLLAGFLMGAGIAVVAGSLIGVSKTIERLFLPTLQALTPIPPPAWIPLLIILFGLGEISKILLIAIGAFIPVFANTYQGFRGADAKLAEVATIFQKSRLHMSWYVLLPSTTPSIITGMRVALGLSWVLLVAAEMISSKMVSESARIGGMGLGWLIYDARRFGRADDMIVGMISMGVLGKVTDMIMEYFEKRLLQWRQAFKGV